jgi:hypothetical protein
MAFARICESVIEASYGNRPKALVDSVSARQTYRGLRSFTDIIPPVPHMALTPGTRLGVYEVITLLGVGEVYKARDTKLNRDVALKLFQ